MKSHTRRRSIRPKIGGSRSGRETEADFSIIALARFIQATRDSGYKGTASAISELVDNSVQARASRISIQLLHIDDGDGAIEVRVLDDGCGMEPQALREALRFGGSSRFGRRTGLGRYGMGLPNSSLSQARHVAVYTWQHDHEISTPKTDRPTRRRPISPYMSYLDVDEIAAGTMREIPLPVRVQSVPLDLRSDSGTVVVWRRCDRLDNRRVSTLARKLGVDLGRRFRHFLWQGLQITINGERVAPIDPLYENPCSQFVGARLFGEELVYEVSADPSNPNLTGHVRIRFTELPVHSWYKLSNDEKRRMGISKGAGVSIVRAGREVDVGWFFMGTKRRENYDDWWRCEVQFEPILDEAFGITHTKQQVRPRPYLLDALSPDVEATARVLNSRARKAHLAAKTQEQFSTAERVAAERDHLLRPMPVTASPMAKALMRELMETLPILSQTGVEPDQRQYRIVEAAATGTCFYSCAFDGRRLVLVLNPEHPFYRDIYRPLVDAESLGNPQLRAKIDLLLLAAARSEVTSKDDRTLARHRLVWSNTLATFLND